jgi:murein DD-endopeptidase MepM/ murein hydrolase activator NlpD
MACPIPDPAIRGVDTPNDKFGGGGFGVSRDGGSRAHGGVDLLADPGDTVTSPVTGTVVATFDPYGKIPAKRGNYRSVSILTDDGYVVRVMYVKTTLEHDDRVIAGQTKIGTVQNLGTTYKGIQNHIHLDIKKANSNGKGSAVGEHLDPTPLVRRWQRD